MFRLILWILIIYFIYRLIQSATRLGGRQGQPPPMAPPTGSNMQNNAGPIGKIEDAEFEELPPDPDGKK